VSSTAVRNHERACAYRSSKDSFRKRWEKPLSVYLMAYTVHQCRPMFINWHTMQFTFFAIGRWSSQVLPFCFVCARVRVRDKLFAKSITNPFFILMIIYEYRSSLCCLWVFGTKNGGWIYTISMNKFIYHLVKDVSIYHIIRAY
jgi:hypothetical protein